MKKCLSFERSGRLHRRILSDIYLRLWRFTLQQAQLNTSPMGNFLQEMIQQFLVNPPILCPPPIQNTHTHTYLSACKHLDPSVLSPPSKALIKPLFRQARHRPLARKSQDLLVFIRIPERINTISRQPRGLSTITSTVSQHWSSLKTMIYFWGKVTKHYILLS